jgi:hypothetical protein
MKKVYRLSILAVIGSISASAFAGVGQIGSATGGAKALAAACMDEDLARAEQMHPLEVDKAIADYNWKSEIYYQIAANRSQLIYSFHFYLKSYKDYSRTMDDVVNKLQDQQRNLEKKADYNGHYKVDKYGREILPPEIAKVRQQLENLDKKITEAIAAPGKYAAELSKPENIKGAIAQIEKDLREDATTDIGKSDLQRFLISKSYGDALIRMANKAQSCEQVHSDYRALALNAAKDHSFKLEVLSVYNDPFFPYSDAEKEVTPSIRQWLKQNHFTKAGAEYTYKLTSSLGALVTNILILEKLEKEDSRISQSDEAKVLRSFDLGPKNQTAEQLEKRADKFLEHTSVYVAWKELALQFIK